MDRPDPIVRRLERLRQWRARREPDLSLGFLREQFRREVQRPHQQVAALAEAWRQLVPPALRDRCTLEGLSRGVLKVAVDDSTHLYELDRLVRTGLTAQLAAAAPKAGLRRVQLRLAQPPAPDRPRQPPPDEGDRDA